MTPTPQLPGCLPEGYTLDSMLTPQQFCVWQGITTRWWSARRKTLPGVHVQSRQHIRIHPRTYIAKAFQP